MKAIIFSDYGPPEQLQLQEVEKPTPQPYEVLVKIHAASANPLDWHRMRGAPFIARLGEGLRKPTVPRLGADFAGTVEAVGSAVTKFKPGDAVFGSDVGAFAEYICASQDHMALKPKSLSFEEAAAVPVVAFTALQGLRNTGRLQVGERVLVNGASGGVGSFAVQLAKALGAAEVTGVCSSRNLELVRSIGADQVIDYTRTDFTRSGQTYDLVYDAVGNRSIRDYRRLLTPQGRCVIAGFTTLPRLFEHLALAPLLSKFGSRKVGMMPTAYTDQADLEYIGDLLETGKITPIIDREYPLSETAEAIRYLETGRARGKVIVNITAALAQGL